MSQGNVQSSKTAQIGVIAIGRNEGERLVRCLTSLRAHGLPVVYVDSASTDGSQDAAKALGANVLALDMAKSFTAARARAEGFAELERVAPGIDYVMFVDGDCETVEDWPPKALAFLEDNLDFAVVCGRRKERFPEASHYNRLIDIEWNSPIGEAEACGGDAIFRCSAYRAVGGFNPAMIAGEEPELCSRLRTANWRLMRMDADMTVHDADMHRFDQWWNRAVRSGLGFAQAWRATRKTGNGLYRVQLRRAVMWALVIPLIAIALAAALHPALIALWPAATFAQFVRDAMRGDAFGAMLSVVGKYAEMLGISRFVLRAMRGQTGGTVEYK